MRVDTRAPAFQVKSYAWSQRTRVAVLTNFRALRIFESTARPSYDDAPAGLLNGLDVAYTDYEGRWEDLWNLLSREAVLSGSVERAGRQRRGALRVDEAFLAELTEWRERLAQDLLARNGDRDHCQLTEATQRILDRLVFLRVCEDRTVEQQVVLRRYARITDAYHALRAEFRRLDVVYNGALFSPHFSERLEVSDDVLQSFIERLYFPYSPYRFDVIDVDLLGAVYERFLGKELVVDSRHRVRLEDSRKFDTLDASITPPEPHIRVTDRCDRVAVPPSPGPTEVSMFDHHLTICAATPHDDGVLRRLARSERRPRIGGRALLAERDGVAIAALSLTSGRLATAASPHARDAARALRRHRYELQRQGGDVGPAWPLLRRPVRSA